MIYKALLNSFLYFIKEIIGKNELARKNYLGQEKIIH